MVVNGLTLSLGELKNKLSLTMCVFCAEFGGKRNINSPKIAVLVQNIRNGYKPELDNSI